MLFVASWFISASAQTTRPIPVAVWDQPALNVPMLAKLGVTVFLGPEVENWKSLPPDVLAAGRLAWIKAVADAGATCILKSPTGPLPSHCVGLMLSVDEPNGHGIPAAALLGERDDLRARYPGVPIFLSLAGDKITSANFGKAEELQAYKDYAALADVLTVDVYAMNRNASRYKTTWTGDAVAKLAGVSGKTVWAWVECNDQQLPNPTSKSDGVHLDVNREPTPDEISATVSDALARGASGIGWFGTADHGQYGWPQSYWPTINRRGISIAPQLERVERISKTLSPPRPDAVAVLQAKVAELEANQVNQTAQIEALGKTIRAIGAAAAAGGNP